MKILNGKNQVIGKVDQETTFCYRYIGNNNITFPIHANSLAAACADVCKYFGDGCFFLLFTI